MRGIGALDTEERLARTIYVRLPFTIKNPKQVRDMFEDDVEVRLTRQSSRHCHVVFSSMAEKIKNMKNVKKMIVNGRRILVCIPRINPPEVRRKKVKKIRVPKPTAKTEMKITKSLFVSNIKPGTNAQEIKEAFPGCLSIVMLKSTNGKNRLAILKMGSIQLSGEYLRKEREWPEVRGNRLVVRPDTRKKNNKPKKKESSGLKIYDGDDDKVGSKETKENDEPQASTSKQSQDESSEEEEEEEEEDSKAEDDKAVEEDSKSEDDEAVDEDSKSEDDEAVEEDSESDEDTDDEEE